MQASLLDLSEIKQYYSELSKGIQWAIQISKSSTEEKLKFNTLSEFLKFFAKFGINLNEILEFEQTSLGGGSKFLVGGMSYQAL
jgi:hypothetical protein